jgi:N6-adenosine-specific RNA methylase IME4
MTLGEICNLGIDLVSFVANPAHLYLWIPNHHLIRGIGEKVCEAWGFRPITLVTWCKPQIGVGYYFRNNTEHLIFAIRGTGLQTKDRTQATWEKADRLKHSQKPDIFYEIIEKMSYPPYLELFARSRREGWDCWGNEVESDIEL